MFKSVVTKSATPYKYFLYNLYISFLRSTTAGNLRICSIPKLACKSVNLKFIPIILYVSPIPTVRPKFLIACIRSLIALSLVIIQPPCPVVIILGAPKEKTPTSPIVPT